MVRIGYYNDSQGAMWKGPMLFIVVVGIVFLVGYGLGTSRGPSDSEQVATLERTLFEVRSQQNVVDGIVIVKDNSTHGHMRINPSSGIGSISEMWVYRFVEGNSSDIELPKLETVWLVQEHFPPSPFTKVTQLFPIEIGEADTFYVVVRFSDRDVTYTESFVVRDIE